MSEQDQALARRVLEKNRLSRGQVDDLLEEAGRTGRSFRDLALGRGLLSAQDFQPTPPRQTSLPVMVLLGVGLSAVALSVVILTMNRAASRPGPGRPPAEKARLDASPKNPK